MMGPNRVAAGEIPPPGLFALAAQDIFRYIQLPEFSNITVHVSFYEIYCGKLRDLLNSRRVLNARDNGQQKVVICGLTEVPVGNVDDFMACINYGLTSRTTGVTGANEDSSRSHAILQIALKDDKGRDAGRVSFIDLAGSERGADVVDQGKQTARDGAEINKSLLALKECIRALDLQKDHTPFRGSKLTMVLKESFLGNCRTLMIANLNPSDQACEHTLNTLRYAYRVKELRRSSGDNEDGISAINQPTGNIGSSVRAPRPSLLPQNNHNSNDYDFSGEDDVSMGGDDDISDENEGDSAPFVSSHPASQLPPPPPTTQGPPPNLLALLSSARGKANEAAALANQQQLLQQQNTTNLLAQSHNASGIPANSSLSGGIAQAPKKSTTTRTGSAFGRPLVDSNNNNNNGLSRPSSPSLGAQKNSIGGGGGIPSGIPVSRRPSVVGGPNNGGMAAAPISPEHSRRSRHHSSTSNLPVVDGTRLNASSSNTQSTTSRHNNETTTINHGASPPALKEISMLTGDDNASLSQLASAHDRLIGTILIEEEELIQSHRGHIDLLVDLIKDEMNLLTDVERSGSDVEAYVMGLKRVLARKERSVQQLADRLASFQKYLEAEETLSRKFQERSNGQQQNMKIQT